MKWFFIAFMLNDNGTVLRHSWQFLPHVLQVQCLFFCCRNSAMRWKYATSSSRPSSFSRQQSKLFHKDFFDILATGCHLNTAQKFNR